jgi:hypothetical protein
MLSLIARTIALLVRLRAICECCAMLTRRVPRCGQLDTVQAEAAVREGPSVGAVLALQRSAGNAAVAGLLARRAPRRHIQRLDATGLYEGHPQGLDLSDAAGALWGRETGSGRRRTLDGEKTYDAEETTSFRYRRFEVPPEAPFRVLETGRFLEEGVLDVELAEEGNRTLGLEARLTPERAGYNRRDGGWDPTEPDSPRRFLSHGDRVTWPEEAIEGAPEEAGGRELVRARQEVPLDDADRERVRALVRRLRRLLVDYFEASHNHDRREVMGEILERMERLIEGAGEQRPLILRELGAVLTTHHRVDLEDRSLTVWDALVLANLRERDTTTGAAIEGLLAQIARYAPDVRSYRGADGAGLPPERAHAVNVYQGQLVVFSFDQFVLSRRWRGRAFGREVTAEAGVAIMLLEGVISIEQTEPTQWQRGFPIGLIGGGLIAQADRGALPAQLEVTWLEPRRMHFPYRESDFPGFCALASAEISGSFAHAGGELVDAGQILVATGSQFPAFTFDTGATFSLGGGFSVAGKAGLLLGAIADLGGARQQYRHIITSAQEARDVSASYTATTDTDYATDEWLLSPAALSRVRHFCARHEDALRNPETRVELYGHADTQWNGPPEEGPQYNYLLSKRRAEGVKREIRAAVPDLQAEIAITPMGWTVAWELGDRGQPNPLHRVVELFLDGNLTETFA